MSQWTHVCGVIRYDDLRRVLMPAFPSRDIPLPALPLGSEGPLEISWKDRDPNSGYSYMTTATIVGDLRDFGEEDVPELKSWWDHATHTLPQGVAVRGAVMQVDVESGPSFTWPYSDQVVGASE